MAKDGVSGARNEGSDRSPGQPPLKSGGPVALARVAPTSEVSAQSRTSNVVPNQAAEIDFLSAPGHIHLVHFRYQDKVAPSKTS
jgi:hypothetical protein